MIIKMTTKIFRILLYTSILLNILDIVLHVVTNQPEILRISGNTLIILASGIALKRRRPNLLLGTGLASYLILNGIFIALNGIGTAGIAFTALTTLVTFSSLVLRQTK